MHIGGADCISDTARNRIHNLFRPRGGSRNLFWGGQTKVPNRKLRAKPESRARSARVSRVKPESRARSARELRAKPEKKRGEGSGERAR